MSCSIKTLCAEVLALDAAATPGPWRRAHHGTHEVEAPPNQLIADCGTIGRAADDAAFIAAARTAAPELARAVLKLLDELEAVQREAEGG